MLPFRNVDFYLQSHLIIKSFTASTASLSIYLIFLIFFNRFFTLFPAEKQRLSLKMAANEATTTIILNSPDKWKNWELKFKVQVVSYNLVNQIFDDAAFLDKPIKPARPIYWTVAVTRA